MLMLTNKKRAAAVVYISPAVRAIPRAHADRPVTYAWNSQRRWPKNEHERPHCPGRSQYGCCSALAQSGRLSHCKRTRTYRETVWVMSICLCGSRWLLRRDIFAASELLDVLTNGPHRTVNYLADLGRRLRLHDWHGGLWISRQRHEGSYCGRPVAQE